MREYLNEALFGIQPSAIRKFSQLAKETPGCLSLTLGEPDFATPLSICAAANAAMLAGDTHYIANSGSFSLRKKIADFEKEKDGLAYEPTEIVITTGATEALFTAFFTVLNPGDEVIIPTPAFVLYEGITRVCRATPVFLDTAEDGFQINRKKLEALITPKTKAIILNTPNNPTGCILTKESLQILHDVLKDKPIFILCDDVYRQLVYTGEYHSPAEYTDLRKQLIVIQSFSKPYAMTGWRMGYLMADAEIMDRLELVHQFVVTSTPAPFQRACEEALEYDPKEFLESYRHRRDYVVGRLQKMGLSVTVPEGAFYAFPSIQKYGMDSMTFCTRLVQEAGLAVTPGSCFGTEGYIRLSYCTSDEILAAAMDRLEGFVNKLEKR